MKYIDSKLRARLARDMAAFAIASLDIGPSDWQPALSVSPTGEAIIVTLSHKGSKEACRGVAVNQRLAPGPHRAHHAGNRPRAQRFDQ